MTIIDSGKEMQEQVEKKDAWDPPEKKKPALIESEEVKKRSKRMFGLMLGTLNSLKEKSSSEIKREKVQEKLLAKLAQEKKEMELKIQQETMAKKSKILEKRKIDDSLRYKTMMETVNSVLEKYSGFCQTETLPPIYFLPMVHSEKSLENLKKSTEIIENLKKSITFNHQEYMDSEFPIDSQTQSVVDDSVDVKMEDSVQGLDLQEQDLTTNNSMQDIKEEKD